MNTKNMPVLSHSYQDIVNNPETTRMYFTLNLSIFLHVRSGIVCFNMNCG
jgi:hypothetical protein